MSAIGLRVGPFEILEEAVVPGTGSWYRARRTALGRRQPAEVLVRLLGPSPSPRELAAVQRQYDALSTLSDRRFPRAIAIYEGSGALAVEAMPALGFGRLIEARLLGDVEMTPSTLLDLALEVTDGLAHAHQHGMFHGHLGADDVALAADGSLWIWGMGEPDARPPFAWLAPERARSEAPGPATDQWSLAALLVALVTGRPPWSPSSADADPRTGDIDGFLEPLARQWPALGRLARRMLDPNPALRFPTLHPVRLELLQLSRRAGGSSDRRSLATWLHRLEEGAADPTRAPIHVDAAPPARVEPRPRPNRPRILSLPSAAAQRPGPAVVIPIPLDDAPDDIATEMAGTEIQGDPSERATPPVPPVRTGYAGPVASPAPGAPPDASRAWIDEPTPTLPGMDVVEPGSLSDGPALRLSVQPGPSLRPEPRLTFSVPSAPNPAVPAVEVEVEPDLEFLVEDDLVALDEEPAVDLDVPVTAPPPVVVAVLADEEDDLALSGPVAAVAIAELEAEIEIESTDEAFVVGFTDPSFVASVDPEPHPLAVLAPVGGPRPSGASPPPSAKFPWEQQELLTLPDPANHPIVRAAPWFASVAVLGLAVLTVVQVVAG
jgi:hypothetical protein